jgi:hypothetical protein
MFKYRHGRDIIDSSISDSIDSLEGLTIQEKDVIYNHVMEGLDIDISKFEKTLSIPEQSGPPLWDFLHWMGKVADAENNPSVYMDALSVISRGHPCAKVCRKHLVDNLRILPTSNYTSMFRHSYDLHNLVNTQLGKRTYPYKDAMITYDVDCDTCTFVPDAPSKKLYKH